MPRKPDSKYDILIEIADTGREAEYYCSPSSDGISNLGTKLHLAALTRKLKLHTRSVKGNGGATVYATTHRIDSTCAKCKAKEVK